jgi:hypothetical protein
MSSDNDGGFVIFSGNKLWYSSKDGIENTICKPKTFRNTNKIRNSAKTRRVIEFQIFEDIKNIEKDQFWVSFFEDAAIGKFPRNLRFNNNILNYRHKNRNVEMPLQGTPLEAAAFVKAFVNENAGIISPTDIKEKKAIDEKCLQDSANIEINNWRQIKNEKQQYILISLFVQLMGEKYELNFEEKVKLTQQIKLGLLSGYLNSTNIILENGNIIEIEGLEFIDSSREFRINTDICKIVKVPKRSNNDTLVDITNLKTIEEGEFISRDLLKSWSRYINDVNKKYN